MATSESRPQEGTPHLCVSGWTGHDDRANTLLYISEREVRSFYHWLDQVLRLEDNKVARELRIVAGDVVYSQAWNQGHSDALDLGESRLSPHAAPMWRSGYENGYALGMSAR